MSTKEKSEPEDVMEWSAEEEIQLFFALDGLKPVGINRHFFMIAIHDRLSKALSREISTDIIWSHLKSMYNLKALDELEPLPFPNTQKEFSLPESDFGALMAKKKLEVEEQKKTEVKTEPSSAKIGKIPVPQPNSKQANQSQQKELDKKVAAKIISETPKRTPKRTRGSMSLESNSPSTTPPPQTQSTKRRRI